MEMKVVHFVQLLAVKTFYSQSKSCTNFHGESRCQEINIFSNINVFNIFTYFKLNAFAKIIPWYVKKIGLVELGEITEFLGKKYQKE